MPPAPLSIRDQRGYKMTGETRAMTNGAHR